MALNRRLIDDSIKLGTEDAIKAFAKIMGLLVAIGMLFLGFFVLLVYIAIYVLV